MGNSYMPGLSGGERQRATIACEMIADPGVLLIDVSIVLILHFIHVVKCYI